MSHISTVTMAGPSWQEVDAGLIAVGVYKDRSLTPLAQEIDKAIGGLINQGLAMKDIKGKKGESHFFYGAGKLILVLGLGRKDKIDSNSIRIAAGAAARAAISRKVGSVAVECFCSGLESCQPMGEGLVLGSYQFLDYKTKDEKNFELKSATVNEIGKAVCFSRDLSNHPGNVTTPTRLADAAKEISDQAGMELTVFDRKEFTEMGMGGLAGVAQGTDEPPKFIILEYYGADKDEQPKVLVGKGLTFDAGGISIKPASKMDEMKYDMCGSATVLGVFKAIAAIRPKINVIGIVPSTENLVGAKAYKPGDILSAYNGKTIEVLNTDAEGRLILADGLSYASKHYEPEFILDFATLTGAVLVALGHIATGIMGTDDGLITRVKESSKNVGEKVWEFPLWPEYCKQIRSNIADVKNIGAPRQAGTIAGGAFLKEFVGENIPWVHFDIAGTAWGVKPDSCNPKGSATGVGIRLVLDLLGV